VPSSARVEIITRYHKRAFKYLAYFTVQREVVPWILKEYRNSLTGYWPRDLCVSAPTGSGKTLAFVLPLVQVTKI